MQLRNNNIHRGLIPFERLFDQNDVDLKTNPFQDTKLEDYNIGSPQEPKFVKLSRLLSTKERAQYVRLMKEFNDDFVWHYEDLKVYNTTIIRHTIPTKEV